MNSFVYLVDGPSLIWPVAHTDAREIREPDDFPIGLVIGFFNSLEKLARDSTFPVRILVGWDGGSPDYRKAIYEDYKKKEDRDEELVRDVDLAIRRVRGLLDVLGIPHLSVSGVECDDVLGALSRYDYGGSGTVIASSDGDLLQLVRPGVDVYQPKQQKYYTVHDLAQKFDFPVESAAKRYVMWKALVGDSSDEIPGVKGIGEKTAPVVVNQLMEEGEVSADLPRKAKEKFESGRDIFDRNVKLIDINYALDECGVFDRTISAARMITEPMKVPDLIALDAFSRKGVGDPGSIIRRLLGKGLYPIV